MVRTFIVAALTAIAVLVTAPSASAQSGHGYMRVHEGVRIRVHEERGGGGGPYRGGGQNYNYGSIGAGVTYAALDFFFGGHRHTVRPQVGQRVFLGGGRTEVLARGQVVPGVCTVRLSVAAPLEIKESETNRQRAWCAAEAARVHDTVPYGIVTEWLP